MKIPPFIATLGLMLILKGLSLVVSGTRPIYFNDTPGFDKISRGSLIGEIFPAVPIPNGVLILFLVAGAVAYILSRTVLGRYCFALGSNEEAVRLSGVNTDRWKIAIYSLSGAIVGIAGLLIASRLNSAQPALGLGYELEAIAAVVIGGTSLSGGSRDNPWNADRGVDHGSFAKWAAHFVRSARMANGCHGGDHYSGRLRRHHETTKGQLIWPKTNIISMGGTKR